MGQRTWIAGLLLLAGCGGGGGDGSAADVGVDGGVDGTGGCTAGERRCAAATVEECDGATWVALETCQDLDPCRQGGRCEAGACLPGLPRDCDDGDPCTVDACSPLTGDCASVPAAGVGGCCDAPADCDDGDPCTADACQDGACAFEAERCAWHRATLGEKGSGEGQLQAPKALAVTRDGLLAVADAGNDRVLLMSRSWEPRGEVSVAFDVALSAPGGVAAAPDGRILVADTGNDRLVWLSADGTVLGQWPPPDFTSQLFFAPVDAAFIQEEDGLHMVIVDGPGEGFDEGNRLLRLNAKGQVIGAQGKTGYAAGNFDNPGGILLEPSGLLRIADRGNDRVQGIDTAFDRASLTEFGSEGAGDGQLAAPSDLARTAEGLILVVDTGNARVQVFGSCQPTCQGKECGPDGCGGDCGGCPAFGECLHDFTCAGWVGEGGEGCTDKTGTGEGGCNGCPSEACMCQGVDPVDPEASGYYVPGQGDPYCCDTEWDTVCVLESMLVCGYSCPAPDAGPLPPVIGYVDQWSHAGDGTLIAPVSADVDPEGNIFVLDAVAGRIQVYRYHGE